MNEICIAYSMSKSKPHGEVVVGLSRRTWEFFRFGRNTETVYSGACLGCAKFLHTIETGAKVEIIFELWKGFVENVAMIKRF